MDAVQLQEALLDDHVFGLLLVLDDSFFVFDDADVELDPEVEDLHYLAQVQSIDFGDELGACGLEGVDDSLDLLEVGVVHF